MCPGLAHRTVRCTREPNSELATFGNSGGRSAIIHRTVRCASGATATPRQRSLATLQWNTTVRACARRSQSRRRRRTGQWTGPIWCTTGLSGGPVVRSSNGRNPTAWWRGWRTGQCPVRHTTEALTNGSFGGWGYKYPQPPHFNASKFSAIKPHTRALDFIPRHKQRDQILSQVRNHSKQISD